METSIKTERQKRIRGVGYILAAAFFFALMNLFVRTAGDVPVFQKCFFRNLVAFFVALAVLIKSGDGFQIGEGNFKYLMYRSVGGLLGVFCNFYAIDHINISDASMLNKLSPFFAIILSTFILKERANRRQWAAVIIAFIGALFVVKPTFSMASLPAISGVLGGFGAGYAYTYVRKLGNRGEKGTRIVLFFSGFSCLATLPYLIFAYHPMEWWQLGSLLLAGCAAAGGQFSITAAYTNAPAKEISVYDYSQVIFAALLGVIFLGQWPDIYSVIGYVIIISVAVIKWRMDNKDEQKRFENEKGWPDEDITGDKRVRWSGNQ
ncbi:MAG: DMT family transporter [Lachnospiraceae bacterium]|nr:DMT family transporter [Lachnospiraceae bacterium]